MKSSIRYIILFLLLSNACLVRAQAAYHHIKNYKAYYGWAHAYPQDKMVLRRFEDGNKTYYLLVNPLTMETEVNDSDIYKIKPMNIAEARAFFKSTPYQKALAKAEKQSVMIQDAGIERGMPKEAGISLTADLCPSHRPLDKVIFTDIFNGLGKVERPVPIALSVTGVWMRQHPQDLEWLKQMEAKREIYITWINHSYNHRVSASRPLKENFLLEPGTDMSYEVLETEQAMLRNGLLPSVFFRFPGLVSDQQLVNRVTDFGLIPIGTDAWLAKGQQPQAGSIVLIHGNGNEPVGVKDFIKLLQSKTQAIANKQWLLYDLRESVDEEFGEVR
ncbi:polysaccharide deacetylase [Mucilaginibacter mali]|uniref:Polysaccharide deacetylase n=1 Tax=Mucilaginibacter mali TaxID=2740462 RepID=A0A7D4UQ76_9SPHI|nr:polysaccharide deacetylase [Mucilaginibacter mali]QKJ32180.1 polysaccharide deacetylase [Mucilaginibacter mali]